jgi:hypothetical protein
MCEMKRKVRLGVSIIECLAQRKCSVNVSYYYLFYVWWFISSIKPQDL